MSIPFIPNKQAIYSLLAIYNKNVNYEVEQEFKYCQFSQFLQSFNHAP